MTPEQREYMEATAWRREEAEWRPPTSWRAEVEAKEAEAAAEAVRQWKPKHAQDAQETHARPSRQHLQPSRGSRHAAPQPPASYESPQLRAERKRREWEQQEQDGRWRPKYGRACVSCAS